MSLKAALLLAYLALAAPLVLTSCGQGGTGDRTTKPPSPSTAHARDPALCAWAVGSYVDDGGGVIYATTDGGRSWHPQQAEAFGGLSAVAFADVRNGWAVGGNGVLLATTDSGTSWAQHKSEDEDNTNVGLSDIACADAQHLWAVGDGILHSSDGGATWSRQDSRECLDVACSDAAHAWVTTGVGPLLATSDGGASWSVACKPGSWGVCVTSLTCDDPEGVWAVGGVGGARQCECVLSSNDGGATWRRRTFAAGFLNDVTLSAPAHVWAVGFERGRIYSSPDGGKHWRVQRVGKEEPASASIELWGIAFSDDLHGWAVGGRNYPAGEYQGVVYATADGGVTWTRQRLAKETESFLAVGCIPSHP